MAGSSQAQDRAGRSPDAGFARRRGRDRALALPLVGVLLLLPPVATIFEVDARLFGVPLTFVYVFGVWAVLIASAAWLSTRLVAGLSEDGGEGSGGAGSESTDDSEALDEDTRARAPR